jgi:hypothetical protein
VGSYLKGLGYDTKPVSSDGQEAAAEHQQLAEVTDLASRVSAATSNASTDAIAERIAKAQSPAELNTIMEEIGAVQS